jgi:hypothetical protein
VIEEEDVRAARYSDLFGHKQEHSDEWALCPICATMRIVRQSHPEVLEHLTAAARELMMAASIILDEAIAHVGEAPAEKSEEGPPNNVRRIDQV